MDTDDHEAEFHKMDPGSVPFPEDPKVILLRDWPPAYSVYLRYESTDQYLGIKKGALVLTSKPSEKWRFVATSEGTIIRNLRKAVDIGWKSPSKIILSASKSEAVGEWKVTPKISGNQVVLTIVSKFGRSGGYLQFEDDKPAKQQPGELNQLKDGSHIPMWILEEPQDLELMTFDCPGCSQTGLHEDALWYHWAQVHGRELPRNLVCPICSVLFGDSTQHGDPTWGYGNHLFHHHGPPSRKAFPAGMSRKHPTYGFSLVIIQHPTTKKFALIEEGAQAGWWLPAGGVDPGEGFTQAAIREAKEEAGIDIVLKGILGFENAPRPNGGGRQRMIFYAHPANPDEPLKSIPDYESMCCVWISYEEMMNDLKSGAKHLRGNEPRKWFKYVEEGGVVYPIDFLYESPAF
jgi:8-oxo-dGTP pyrophosphatase MutT (NUDIX family)